MMTRFESYRLLAMTYADRLGVDSDAQIAKDAGVSASTIRNVRIEYDVPPVRPVVRDVTRSGATVIQFHQRHAHTPRPVILPRPRWTPPEDDGGWVDYAPGWMRMRWAR